MISHAVIVRKKRYDEEQSVRLDILTDGFEPMSFGSLTKAIHYLQMLGYGMVGAIENEMWFVRKH